MPFSSFPLKARFVVEAVFAGSAEPHTNIFNAVGREPLMEALLAFSVP